jgi:hypothetical protein
MAKRTKIIAVIIVIVILGAVGFAVYRSKTVSNNLLGGDRDEHGCIGSAGYSWCEVKQKCLRVWEEKCEAGKMSTVDTLQQLFAKKYPKYATTVSVKINQETENHARGSVNFASGAPGGIFLAAKINGKWQIIHDGNGQIPCSLSEYEFPKEMLKDCSISP